METLWIGNDHQCASHCDRRCAGYFVQTLSEKERYQDTIIKATGFSVVFLGAAGTLSKILTVRPDGTLSTGGSMVMMLSLALGALLGERMDLDAQFERFGEWLKHKTGSDGDFMNRNLTRSVIV